MLPILHLCYLKEFPCILPTWIWVKLKHTEEGHAPVLHETTADVDGLAHVHPTPTLVSIFSVLRY